ncbi:MAG: Asp-tRNA(Asn)/Glu-tRNA(Gln) amidotransferase GatCAB subunit C [Balneola sp.]|nr:Asp-tRNA(Asn)/Glu-tRNA(Gln) amidotransferase GatCAB subunit C [Balneola sp.]|tara:strand:+ start:2326 stop:2613 length:288 start_codon:yes stop_codon:yes gene_type:complete
MSVSKEEVQYVAGLAKLHLSEEEISILSRDMNAILGYMELLNNLDTSDVEPLEHVIELSKTYRADKAHEPLTHEKALKNAPDADSDYFRVPKVIE